MYKHGGDIYSNVDCLDFSANINFLGMPAAVRNAVINSIDKCVHYPDVRMTELKSAISEREQLDLDYIICGNGAAELIYAVTAAVKPKKALIFAPSFHEYEQSLANANAELMVFELKEENSFLFGEKEETKFLNMIDSNTDIVFICNPNNPTGILTDRTIIERILARCERNNSLLVVDECFLDFVDNKELFSMRDFVSKSKNIFVLKAFTKIFAMPGLRLGYGLCSDSYLIKKIKNILQPWNVSVPAQAAGVVASGLKHFEKETLDALLTEKRYLLNAFDLKGIRVYGSAANFLFFKEDVDFGKKMRSENILVRDCSNYRGLQSGFYRIAVRSHSENKEFINCLNKIC